jgi:hypothetical protein
MALLLLRWSKVIHGVAMDAAVAVLSTVGIGAYALTLYFLHQDKTARNHGR